MQPDTGSASLSQVERRRQFLINLAFFLVVFGIAVLAIRYLVLWMLPFVFAFVVAAAIQYPLRWLVKKTGGNRKFFSVVLVVLVVLLLAGLVAAIGWQLVSSVLDFFADSDRIQGIEAAIRDMSTQIEQGLTAFLGKFSAESAGSVQATIQTLTDTLLSFLSDLFTAAAGGAVTFTTTKLPSLLIGFIIWIIASIFLSIEYHQVTSFLLRQVPERFSPLLQTTRAVCSNTLLRLLRAYALLMLITFLELSIGLSILGLSNSILLAAIIALVDILPVLGTGTVLIPWTFVSLLTGNTRLGIGLAVLYVIITVLRNILEPRIVSHQIGLSPLVTLFFMYLGLQSCGLLGMLLFPVGIIVLKQLQDDGHIRLWK